MFHNTSAVYNNAQERGEGKKEGKGREKGGGGGGGGRGRGARKERLVHLLLEPGYSNCVHRFLGNGLMTFVNTFTNQKLARAFTHD